MESHEADFDYHVAHTNWRVHPSTGKQIYAMRRSSPSSRDDWIGTMDTSELASEVVRDHNLRLLKENARLSEFDTLKRVEIHPEGPPEVIRSGETIRFHTNLIGYRFNGPAKCVGLLDLPYPAQFGMTHLKIGRDGSTVRRGVLDA